MDALWVRCVFLLACCCASGLGSANKCDEVRKVFQLRQIGPSHLLPSNPRPGTLRGFLPDEISQNIDSNANDYVLIYIFTSPNQHKKHWLEGNEDPRTEIINCCVATLTCHFPSLLWQNVHFKYIFMCVCAVMVMTEEDSHVALWPLDQDI